MSAINNSKTLDQRLGLLTAWLKQVFDDDNFVITAASDDASFRRYFRIKHNYNGFIAMDAPPAVEDCKLFVSVGQYLIAGGVRAPKIIDKNLEQGLLLLEDFGDQTFLKAQQQSLDIKHYKNAIDTLIKIQSLPRAAADIPSYDEAALSAEMQLLIDWYLPPLSHEQDQQLQNIFSLLNRNALSATQVFVHRDYHSRNLMLLGGGEIGVLDFQDAVIGANTYDLVSLLKDAYFELTAKDLQTLLIDYYQKAKVATPLAEFEKQFELMGLQRHLKVLGVFTRLSLRDGKHQYLGNIPLVKKYALQTANRYPELNPLKDIL